MAPRKWSAWVVDSTGKRIERSGEGAMPSNIHDQMKKESGIAEAASSGSSPAVDDNKSAPSPAPTPAPVVPVLATPVVPVPATPASTTPTSVVPAQSDGANPAPIPVQPVAAAPTPAAAPPSIGALPHAPGVASASAAADLASPSSNPTQMGSTASAGVSNPAMIAIGAALIATLAIFAVAAVLIYRRRLNRKQQERTIKNASMFLDVSDNDMIATPPKASIKGRKIGEPVLITTSASEAFRGPGLVSAGSKPAIRSNSKKEKPKLTLAMYKTNPAGVGGPTILPPSPSPRTSRQTPSGFMVPPSATHDISLMSPSYQSIAPSPRRVTPFDCAPSPLPVDSRQRLARGYDPASMYSDALPSPGMTRTTLANHPHRRTRSRGSINTNPAARQAFYGQHGLNRLSTASSSGVNPGSGDSFLNIPVSSRYSFDKDRWSGESQDIHGMI